MKKSLTTHGVSQRPIHKYHGFEAKEEEDKLIVEEALEIRVQYRQQQHQVAITMRTPGNDYELALGFLFSEAIISGLDEVKNWQMLNEQVILIELKVTTGFNPTAFQRNTFVSSSCGICGKASLDQIQTHSQYLPWSAKTAFSLSTIYSIPTAARNVQPLFQQTGGNHAVAICDQIGAILYLAEDVGRHNAMDKAIGWAMKNEMLPLTNHMILLSGRASYELVQKAMMLGLPLLAAIGAPSSAAVDLAEEVGMTLLGFLKTGKANVYAHHYRLER